MQEQTRRHCEVFVCIFLWELLVYVREITLLCHDNTLQEGYFPSLYDLIF